MQIRSTWDIFATIKYIMVRLGMVRDSRKEKGEHSNIMDPVFDERGG